MINYDDHRQDIQKDIARISKLLNTSNLLRVQRFVRDTLEAQQGKRDGAMGIDPQRPEDPDYRSGYQAGREAW